MAAPRLFGGQRSEEEGSAGICEGTLSPVDEHKLLHGVGRVSQRLAGHRLVLVVLIPQQRQIGELLLILHPGRCATDVLRDRPTPTEPGAALRKLPWLLATAGPQPMAAAAADELLPGGSSSGAADGTRQLLRYIHHIGPAARCSVGLGDSLLRCHRRWLQTHQNAAGMEPAFRAWTRTT